MHIKSVETIRPLRHKHLNKVFCQFEDDKSVYFILEYFVNHSLFLEMILKHVISSTDAKVIFDQITDTLEYLLSKNLCTKSLRAENIYIDNSLTLMLTESIFVPEVSYHTAPEGWTSKEADLWAIGALLFEMTQGNHSSMRF